MKGCSLQRRCHPVGRLVRESCPSHRVSLRRENNFCLGQDSGQVSKNTTSTAECNPIFRATRGLIFPLSCSDQ